MWLGWMLLPGRTRSLSASSDEKYPIARVCPACGSTEYLRITQSITLAWTTDRECRACGTRYAPPPSMVGGVVWMLVGLAVGGPCAWMVGYWLLRLLGVMGDPGVKLYWGSLVCPGVGLVLGVALVWHGVGGFRWWGKREVVEGKRRRHGRRG